jgi:hypothetical protein
MAVEYEQISDDDLNKSLVGGRAAQVTVAPNPAVAPVAEKPRTAVAPPKRSSDASSIAGASAPPAAGPAAAPVDLTKIVEQVTEGTTQMQENLPKPNTQDSAQQMMDLIGKHWQVPAAIAGTAAAAAILHHIMKKDGGAGPPPPPGGLANPIEPQMSTNQQRPTEPYLESEKPTIQSRTFGSKESMVETGINNKYPFTLQDAKTALGLGNVPIKNAQEAELVAQQYAKQLKAQSSLTEVINTPAPSINNPSPSTNPVGAPATPVFPVGTQESMNRVSNMQGFTGADTANQGFLDAIKERQAVPPITPAATLEPITPAEPVATTTETPATKATNDQILETLNKVAPKPEVTPIESTLGKPDLTTGSGMPAYQGKGEEGGKLQHKKGVFESLKQIPKDYVFVPNGQNMDTVRNAVGQVEYKKNLKSSGGYPTSQQAAHEQSKSINQSLGRVSNAEAKAAGTFVEPTPSITQKVAGLKTVKVAGMTGALILATDLASAATTGESPLANMAQGFKEAVKNKDYGMAASQVAELLNFHPYTLLANQLFGSSPEELRILREADQARKAKAGNAATSRK